MSEKPRHSIDTLSVWSDQMGRAVQSAKASGRLYDYSRYNLLPGLLSTQLVQKPGFNSIKTLAARLSLEPNSPEQSHVNCFLDVDKRVANELIGQVRVNNRPIDHVRTTRYGWSSSGGIYVPHVEFIVGVNGKTIELSGIDVEAYGLPGLASFVDTWGEDPQCYLDAALESLQGSEFSGLPLPYTDGYAIG